MTDFAQILSNFELKGSFIAAQPHGNGHINDTYAAFFQNGNHAPQRYVVQRINHHVFKQPHQVMENIQAVTRHLSQKIEAAGGNPNRETLRFIPANDGRTYLQSPDGNYWRVYRFIENATTYDLPENLDHVDSAARAFGRFQRLLDDFPTDQLHETIVDFHHTARRLETFRQVVAADRLDRAKTVQPEIDFVLQRAAETALVVDLLETGELPLRVTHNDTKFNNVLIDDQTGEGICVIDLDTVMPGSLLYDFGDAIRSIANTDEEDQPDLSKVHFDMEVFATYAAGYLAALADVITLAERQYLAFSARLMTLECGLRFLGDYLDGDRYFRVHHPRHNLDRCRTQFKLVAEMEAQFDAMQAIIAASP